ncbi:MAG: ribonucleoside-diphosphate reductase, adenosylcobalamin-dependent, partial [Planctomycetes bacterium]|nr:ribonucleoside-diphosphate reductase, adenosylcobalamin-dependent [Planctomycetota bacterium]
MEENEYFGSELGVDIWNNKYRNDNESFDDWLTRVSGGDSEVHQLIKEKKFMFGGRILANRGIEGKNVSMSNCYYLGIKDDSLESIYETAGKLARIFSAGGGVGIDLSTLAPRGAKINNAAKTTSGAVSFAQLFNTTSELIGTGGRRSALLLSLKSEHPDLLEFIDAKANNDSIMKANLSVQVSDAFMNNVKHGFDHWMQFERHNGSNTHTRYDANYILDRLVKNNYNWAEPGIQYFDRMKDYNMMQYIGEFEFEGTNACSEKVLVNNGSCLLGSLNLSEFVYNGVFNNRDFNDAVRVAICALNDVLDEGVDKHPLKEQCDVANKWRDIGLGVMGYADALIKLGITYGSDECIEFTAEISGDMFRLALIESSHIDFEDSIFTRDQLSHLIKSDIVNRNCSNSLKDKIERNGLRNCALLSIAPTGSISTMLGISGGIEPHYALSYTRRTESLHGEEKSYDVEIPIVEEWFKNAPLEEHGKLPSYFVTAKDIHWKE